MATTKKEAHQIAAQTMLKLIEQDPDDDRSSTSSDYSAESQLGSVLLTPVVSTENVSACDGQSIDTTCISKLITVCQENFLKMPKYDFYF